MIEIDNLKWQLDYERKLSEDMNVLLENKVSTLMAEKDEFQKTIVKLQGEIEEGKLEHKRLEDVNDVHEQKIKTINAEFVDMRNENDDLKLKGGKLSPVLFDKLESELNLQKTENIQKASKIV